VEAEQIAACEKVESIRSAIKEGEGEGDVERKTDIISTSVFFKLSCEEWQAVS
jgi:hypothetical protein